MLDCLRHEVFYVNGTHAEPAMGIYCGWTAQAGSFAASQLFENEQRDVALILSGECFAPAGKRESLRQAGHVVGPNPGDWLVHQYEESGVEFFKSLNGLFSGVLIDRRVGRAFVFNDRYGIERLYWSETSSGFYFASEAKALLRVLPECRSFDEQGVAQFLNHGCTLGERTLFKDVRLAPGASLWEVKGRSPERRQYFTPHEWESQSLLDAESFQRAFTEVFRKVLPGYFEGSAQIGISLTGGLDTRMIMACLPEQSVAPVCYTYAADNPELRDARVAEVVARACGLSHRVLAVGKDFLANFGVLADRTVYLTDGCFGVLGAHEIYLSEQARQLSPVRITGNFGSEVFRSVSTFKPLGLDRDLFGAEATALNRTYAEARVEGLQHSVSFAAFQEIPWNLFGSLAAGRTQVNFRTPYLDNELVALAYRAPQEVRANSASAVRFVRETSPRLAAIPTDRGDGGTVTPLHRALRRAWAEVTFKLDYMCSEGLPFGLTAFDPFYQWCNRVMGIQGTHKFLTYRNWLQRELAPFAAERLARAAEVSLPFIDKATVLTLAKRHASGAKNFTREINAVLTLESVDRLLLKSDGN